MAEDRANMRVLLAASYLHDPVNLPRNDPDRHLTSRRAATDSEPILAGLGFSAGQISATQHAIVAHGFSASIPPETTEARILRDADRLNVGEAAVEQLPGTVDGEVFGNVDILAAAVIAATGIAFGIFVGHHQALRLHHGGRDDVPGRGQLDLVALAARFGCDRARKLWITVGK